MSKTIRNTKRAMTWLQTKPSYDDLLDKIKDIKQHMKRHGSDHPSYLDFSSALFLLEQEKARYVKRGDHLQVGFDFGVVDDIPTKKDKVYSTYKDKAARDSVYKKLQSEQESL
jgi:hypothetical protein